jgi:EmrB/QacA subfamily drug resistance transporter
MRGRRLPLAGTDAGGRAFTLQSHSQTTPMTNPPDILTEKRSARILMLMVCIGLFMIAIANRAMLISLPTLTQYFDTTVTVMQWTLLVYDLTIIGLVLTLGRLGDLFGRKKFYVYGFVLFSVGSALCGLARSPGQMISFRILQGIGAAMLMANGRAIIVAAIPAGDRVKALATTSAAFHVGFLTGPSLGGFIIDALGWRWVFFINFPVGLIAAWLGWKYMRETALSKDGEGIDYLGAGYLLISMSGLVYAMNHLPQEGLTHPTVWIGLLLCFAALALFIRTELRTRTPILNLALFRSRLFSASNLSLFFVSFTQTSFTLLLVFYLQNLMKFTPTQMGWVIITNSMAVILFSPLAGKISERIGARALCTAGTALIVTGQFMIASLTLESSVFGMVFPIALTGLGWSMFNAPNQSIMLSAVPPGHIGAASGMNVTTARIGGTIGLAIGSAIFTYALSTGGFTHAATASTGDWNAEPEVFMTSFKYTLHILNVFGLLAVYFAAARGRKADAA